MPLLLGSESETVDTIVQVDGEALSMSAKDFSQTLGDGSSGLPLIYAGRPQGEGYKRPGDLIKKRTGP
jgi:hypothetical protein